MGPDGPKWGQEDFVLLIQTLPTFWAERILILIISIFLIFLASSLGPGLGAGFPLPTHPGIKYVARTLAATIDYTIRDVPVFNAERYTCNP